MTACDQCHERDAIITLTQVADGQVTQVHLCERCAAEKGVENTAALAKSPLGSFLAAMGKPTADAPEVAGRDLGACPGCGATLQDFRESGRLGCAECYRTFAPALRELLRRIHGSTHHVGERYADRGQEPLSVPERQDELREQLRRAIETENFELAAELRDRLRVLE